MIEHIFISDSNKKLLFGAHQTLIDLEFCNNKNEINENIDLSDINDYCPILYRNSHRIAQLRINDIILNILYNEIDNFQAAKYLLDLKNLIEDKIITIDSKNVQKSYFLLLDLLQTPNLDYKYESENRKPSENIYIDIVQNIYFLSRGKNIIINKSHGEVFMDNCFAEQLNFRLGINQPINVRSTHMVQENRGEIEVKCENIESSSLFSFYQKNVNIKYFKMTKTRNLLTLESEYKGIFKHIEITVAMGDLTYKVDTQVSNGKCEFDIKTGLLYWRFRDTNFKKETLKFNISELKEQQVNLPVVVNFRIENSECSPFKLISITNKAFPNQKIWVRNTIQSGIYELNNE